jgi:hypothetical protein
MYRTSEQVGLRIKTIKSMCKYNLHMYFIVFILHTCASYTCTCILLFLFYIHVQVILAHVFYSFYSTYMCKFYLHMYFTVFILLTCASYTVHTALKDAPEDGPMRPETL